MLFSQNYIDSTANSFQPSTSSVRCVQCLCNDRLVLWFWLRKGWQPKTNQIHRIISTALILWFSPQHCSRTHRCVYTHTINKGKNRISKFTLFTLFFLKQRSPVLPDRGITKSTNCRCIAQSSCVAELKCADNWQLRMKLQLLIP